MSCARLLLATMIVSTVFTLHRADAAEFTAEKTDKGVTVKLDGKEFIDYLMKSGSKPAIWPIIGPTGKAMTRPWPMDTSEVDAAKKDTSKKDKSERPTTDHEWHRSMWFGYIDVNGVNMWEDHPGRSGTIKHREFKDVVADGPTAKIVTVNDWLDAQGKKLLEDERTVTCSTEGENRIIDFDITLKATDGDVTFGDDKDGVFGMRVRDSMRVDAKKGGSFVNNEGKVDERENPQDPKSKPTVWGQPASWVDYHGPIEGETLGIAILNHPSSFGYPTRWHTRDYGLFAANPFARKAFDSSLPAAKTVLKAGDTMTFRFRVILHKGDEKEGHIAEAWEKYSK